MVFRNRSVFSFRCLTQMRSTYVIRRVFPPCLHRCCKFGRRSGGSETSCCSERYAVHFDLEAGAAPGIESNAPDFGLSNVADACASRTFGIEQLLLWCSGTGALFSFRCLKQMRSTYVIRRVFPPCSHRRCKCGRRSGGSETSCCCVR